MKEFADYEAMPRALTPEEMQSIHHAMLLEIRGDEEAEALYERLLGKAIRYTGIRAEWPTLSKEEKADADPGRTSAHNSVINNFNILARYLKQTGKTAAWREELGDEQDPYHRKRIGDMANYIVLAEALNAR